MSNADYLNKISFGDCLDLMTKLDDNSVDMVLCDLPYGTTARNKWDIIIPFELLWKEYRRICKPNAAMVFTSMQPFTSKLVSSNYKDFKYEWIWRKQQGTGFLNAKKQPLRNHESIIVFYQQQSKYNPQFTEGKPYKCKSGRASSNYREQVSVITENDGKRCPLTCSLDYEYDKDKIHPTQKPLGLFEYLIKTYTDKNDVILDNCSGAGTTAIAAMNLERNFICFENDQEIYDKSVARLENIKGKNSVVSTGNPQ